MIPIDIIIFGSVGIIWTTIYIIVMLLAHATMSTVEVILFSAATAAAITLCSLIIIYTLKNRISYTTKHGTKVRLVDLKVEKAEVEQLLDFFIKDLPLLAKRGGRSIDRMSLQVTVSALELTLTRDKVVILQSGWLKEVNGAQRFHEIVVRVPDGVPIHKTALFHELLHMVDELVLKRPPDYKHIDKLWWNLVPILKKRYEGSLTEKGGIDDKAE